MPADFKWPSGEGTCTGTIHDVLDNTGWKLLSKQKLALLESIRRTSDYEIKQYLIGLLHWIDAVQDAAEADGYPVVFLTEKED